MGSRDGIVVAGMVALFALGPPGTSGTEVKPPAKPAEVAISVSPEGVAPGQSLRVRLDLQPIAGVKLNRYPKVKLQVPGHDGLVGAVEAAVGSDAPPPLDKMNTNYFEKFGGLELELHVDDRARPGQHKLDATLTYFYCMPASGFCAPHRAAITIPLTVR